MGAVLAGRGSRRRGWGRAVCSQALIALAAATLAACGKSGEGARTDPEKGADAAALNAALGRELTLLRAYTAGRARLGATGTLLRSHQQQYVNALTRALRNLGGDVEARPARLGLPRGAAAAAILARAYEQESAALAGYLEQAPRFNKEEPRTLAAALAAAHAQHLVLLRQALGAAPREAVAAAFDGGEVPPPERKPPSQQG